MGEVILAPERDRTLNGLQAVGWYHSHIRSKISLSERDLELHSRRFPAPFQVAVVLRPSAEGPTRAGFFFREASGAIRTESSYEEFPLRSEPSEPVLQTRARPATLASLKRDAPALETPERERLACPKCGCKQLRRSHRTNAFQRLPVLFGYYPYRCQECLSRSFLKTSDLLDAVRPNSHKRPEERRRAWLRARREMLLWSVGILGFLVVLHYLIRETDPKSDQP
jgi:hypothetical protein